MLRVLSLIITTVNVPQLETYSCLKLSRHCECPLTSGTFEVQKEIAGSNTTHYLGGTALSGSYLHNTVLTYPSPNINQIQESFRQDFSSPGCISTAFSNDDLVLDGDSGEFVRADLGHLSRSTTVQQPKTTEKNSPCVSPASNEPGSSALERKNGKLTSRSAKWNSTFSRMHSLAMSSNVLSSAVARARIFRVLKRHIKCEIKIPPSMKTHKM